MGVRPSELLGIGCEWCAFCVDEALFARERARAAHEAEEAEEERKMKAEQERLDRLRKDALG